MTCFVPKDEAPTKAVRVGDTNEPYVRYLEAKRDELEAQVKLCMDLSYYKDAVIRRLRAQLFIHNIEPD